MLPGSIPARYFQFARITIDGAGVPQADSCYTKTNVPGNQLTLVVCDKLMVHNFHFLEVFFLLYAVKMEYFLHYEVTEIHFGRQAWNNENQANAQRSLINTVFPRAQVVELQSGMEILRENVLLIDRLFSRTKINKFLESSVELCMRWCPRIRDEIYTGLSITPSSIARTLYVRRTPPRYLMKTPEQKLMAMLNERRPVLEVEFSGMTWEDQVRISAAADLIVGVHGNGLSNAVWAKSGAALLEIFPPGAHHYDYQVFSEIMGTNYCGIEDKNVYRQFCRQGPPKGSESDANVPIADLDWDTVDFALFALRNTKNW